MKEFLVILSGILFFAGFFPYFIKITKGKTQPRLVSWLIWAAVDVTLMIDKIREGSLNGQIIGAVAGVGLVLYATVRHSGSKSIGKDDVLPLIGAVIGISLSIFLSATSGIIVCAITIVIGGWPTFKSAWKKPELEDKLSWMLWWLSCLAAMMTIPEWTVENAAQPISFTVVESTVVYLIFVRPIFRK